MICRGENSLWKGISEASLQEIETKIKEGAAKGLSLHSKFSIPGVSTASSPFTKSQTFVPGKLVGIGGYSRVYELANISNVCIKVFSTEIHYTNRYRYVLEENSYLAKDALVPHSTCSPMHSQRHAETKTKISEKPIPTALSKRCISGLPKQEIG